MTNDKDSAGAMNTITMELRKQWVAEDGAALTSYLDSYAFDNAYTPTVTERLLLDDALNGWEVEQFEVWFNRIESLRQPTQSDAQIIAIERKAIAAWLRGEVETDYTDPEYDIGRNLADAVERGAYLQEQSK